MIKKTTLLNIKEEKNPPKRAGSGIQDQNPEKIHPGSEFRFLNRGDKKADPDPQQ
jgi:hypothetical protein